MADSSTRFAPCLSQWLAGAREVNMQVAEGILNCTAFLGKPVGHGFVAEGTCFFVQLTEDGLTFIYAVSARHIVHPFLSDRDQTPNPESIWMRFNRKAQQATKNIETKRSGWRAHPDRFVDICVYPFDVRIHDPKNQLSFSTLVADAETFPPHRSMILTDDLKTHWNFGLGDEIFIPSLFVGRVGDRRNIPVIRVATVAAMDLELVAYGSPRKPAYLIETKSLGGTSGAPVFFHTRPSIRMLVNPVDQTDGDVVTPYLLLGMLIGAHGGQYGGDFIGDDENPVSLKDVEFNAGISVVLPISQVMEVINSDQLQQEREDSKRARKELSGCRSTDAS